MIPPTPAPQVPYAVVIAPAGVNVRTGPGTEYPVLGIAPFNTKGVISGKSADRQVVGDAAAGCRQQSGLGVG